MRIFPDHGHRVLSPGWSVRRPRFRCGAQRQPGQTSGGAATALEVRACRSSAPRLVRQRVRIDLRIAGAKHRVIRGLPRTEARAHVLQLQVQQVSTASAGSRPAESSSPARRITRMRIPRMYGQPPHWARSMVMRSCQVMRLLLMSSLENTAERQSGSSPKKGGPLIFRSGAGGHRERRVSANWVSALAHPSFGLLLCDARK